MFLTTSVRLPIVRRFTVCGDRRCLMPAMIWSSKSPRTAAATAYLRCSPGEERPPIHDGGDLWIGSDRNKKALAVPVDCVRTVVADDRELFPK